MRKLNKILIFFIIITILFFQNPFWAIATDEETVEENIVTEETDKETETEEGATEESEEEILQSQKEELEEAVSESTAQIEIVEEELSEALAEVESLSIKIAEKQEEIDDLESEEIALMSYIEESEEDLAEYTEQYESAKALLEARLVAMYEMGDIKYLDVLVNSENLSDFLSRYYLISEIAESDYEIVATYEDSKIQMESITESLKEKKEELEQNKVDIEKYKISLSNMEILKNNKIASLNEEELVIYEQIEEYMNEISSIESEIKTIALQNLGETYIGGTMIWPTPGYTTITSYFGMRTHPITGIYKLHTGVDIGAPYGASFVASNDGVVIKAEYNTAYGNMVMIDHGGGVVTLYAHGSEILVSAGDVVTQGTAVLKVGSTGYSTGAHAHFEIRINGEYVDPLDYVSPDNSTSNTNSDETEESEEIEEIIVELDE